MEDDYDAKRLDCLRDMSLACRTIRDKYGDVLMFFTTLLLVEAMRENISADLSDEMIAQLEEKAKLDYFLMMKATGPGGEA